MKNLLLSLLILSATPAFAEPYGAAVGDDVLPTTRAKDGVILNSKIGGPIIPDHLEQKANEVKRFELRPPIYSVDPSRTQAVKRKNKALHWFTNHCTPSGRAAVKENLRLQKRAQHG